jgi:carboxyl-terminal processing protease
MGKQKGRKMLKTMRGKVIVLLIGMVILAGASFTGGVVYDQLVLQANTQKVVVPPGTTKDFQLLVDAWNTIQQNYVDRSAIQDTPLTYGAISGMVNALGDTGHSRFESPQVLSEETAALSGTFEGIGAEVEMKNGNVVIVTPYEGSPAQKAGVKPGDIIVKVDGVDVTGMSLDSVVQRILGPAGTQVTITLADPNTKELRTLTITRAKISIHNVTWTMIPGTTIADIHIAGFSAGVTTQVKQALQAIQAQGATGLVLDLRDNPGGYLDEAIGVTSQFLKSGSVLEEKNAQGKITQVPVQPGGIATSIPMVVLINQGTASAAEIVSGALQDYNRATLIGETTFGTGTVLNTFTLPDQSALLLATQEWLTPKGRAIWHQGISPDQALTLPANAQPVFPEMMAQMTGAQLDASQDTQLLQAIKVLSATVSVISN